MSTVALPRASKRISAYSSPGAAARSIGLVSAIPRSKPLARAASRRAAKPFQSAISSARSMLRSNSPQS
jgi:hypothetical protein